MSDLSTSAAPVQSLTALDFGTPFIDNPHVFQIIELPIYRHLADRARDLATRWNVPLDAVVALGLHSYLESEPTQDLAEILWEDIEDLYLFGLPAEAWGPDDCCPPLVEGEADE
jgi:hypothetical protein